MFIDIPQRNFRGFVVGFKLVAEDFKSYQAAYFRF